MDEIINKEALMQDTAQLFVNFGGCKDFDTTLDWIRQNEWFVDKMMQIMFDAQAEYISEFISKNLSEVEKGE